jgi:hypothetical protein
MQASEVKSIEEGKNAYDDKHARPTAVQSILQAHGRSRKAGKAKALDLRTCDRKTDLTAEPYKTDLEHDFDTASQIDLQAKQKGETVSRLG